MPSDHISPSANTSNPLHNSPHAHKTDFTQCQHLKPPSQLPPCPPTHFTHCQHLKPHLQLSASPQNTFHPVPTPQTPFSTTPLPSKHISPSATISNPVFNCPHALKTHFTQCQHLKPPFQLPPCPQNTFHPLPRLVVSAEMRFSADKGSSAERPAGARFLAEKWRRRQLRSTWPAREWSRRPLPPATYALPNLTAPKTSVAPEISDGSEIKKSGKK